MKKLLILAIIFALGGVSAFGKDGISTTSEKMAPGGTVGIKPTAKPTLSERVSAAIDQVIFDDSATETDIIEAKAQIVDDEVTAYVQEWADSIAPIPIEVVQIETVKLTLLQLAALPIDQIQLALVQMKPQEISKLTMFVYDFGYQARALSDTADVVKASEAMKKMLRLLPIKQYPAVVFPFIETTNDDPGIYWVDVSHFVNIVQMREEIKNKDIKLAVLGLGPKITSGYNNVDMVEKGLTVKDFALSGKEFGIVYQAFKEIRPDVPVGFIAIMHPTLQAWLDSFSVQPDCWLLFNVDGYDANWQKIKRRWFANKPVIADLNFGGNVGVGTRRKYGTDEYRACIEKLKVVGFSGGIFWRAR